MFLQIPKMTSFVDGITVRCELIPENIAYDEGRDQLMDEHLRLYVEHDGSNPFCDAEECCWGTIFTMSTTNTVSTLIPDEECPFHLICLPNGTYITEATVCEETAHDMPGIWLLVATNTHTDGYEYSFMLHQYALNG